MMTSADANPNTKLSDRDRLPCQRQCVTAGGETIFFIYPNGHISPETISPDDGVMTLEDQAAIGER